MILPNFMFARVTSGQVLLSFVGRNITSYLNSGDGMVSFHYKGWLKVLCTFDL